MTDGDRKLYEQHVLGLRFVKKVRWIPDRGGLGDEVLMLETPGGTFRFALETKRSYLDRAIINALIARAAGLQARGGREVLILARYIPRPTGERLAEAGINFVDAEGNMHLGLGKKYQSLILGKVRKSRSSEGRSLGPAAVQLLFTLAAMPDSVNWTVRRLASVAGVGKTATAQARQRWVAEGILHRSSDGECRVVNSAALHDQCLVGYSRVLRPRLLLGRYRSKEKDPGEFLARFKSAAKETGTRWALTGGPATYALQRFYRGEETPVFVNELAPDIVRRLKLLPDQKGPIILLRAFGEVVNWRTANDMPIAQPWLIYAELMYQDDPRAHEAAEQLRREYLKQ